MADMIGWNVYYPTMDEGTYEWVTKVFYDTTATVRLDIGLLSNLAHALGSVCLTLVIRGAKDVVFVEGDNGAKGAILPSGKGA